MTIEDHILHVLSESVGPMKKADVVEAVLSGVDSSESTVSNYLTNLYKAGHITRPKHGQYAIAASGDGARVAEPTEGYDAEKARPADGGETGVGLPLSQSEKASNEEVERAGYARIEHVAVEAQGGPGSPVHWEKIDGSTLVPVQWARDQYGAHPDRVKRIRVTGNSMVPTIPPGSHIHIVILQPDQEPVDGSIYILRGPYGLMVKRIKIENSFEENEDGEEVGKRYVWLWSDNEDAGRDRLPEEVFRHDYDPVALVRRIEASL